MAVSPYRIIAILVLAALVGSLVLAAVFLLARGPGLSNAPIQVLVPTPDNLHPSPRFNGRTPLDARLLVYVSGAVHSPGVYSLQAGDRLMDAVAAAGGATADADLSGINLARRVQDEAHYHIPRIGETAQDVSTVPRSDAAAPSAATIGATTTKGLINLNTATVDLLDTLPGIGKVRAKAIVDYRERNGPFKSVQDITKVSGIGPTHYENIRRLVTVDVPP